MSIENIEMNKQRKSLDNDVKKLVDKYIKHMDWDVPDINEAKARQLILDEIKLAISRLED
ncbi:MAG TPA: hypothetical protein ENK70_00775 [Methylophaga sp.]|nr:MAG: hypothetical protein DRQ35_02860 [Gammaproteobacteria bacterium]HHA18226.1 hypothetical protein [Methylophaga sp.]